MRAAMMTLMAPLPVAAVKVDAIGALVNRRLRIVNDHLSLVKEVVSGSCVTLRPSCIVMIVLFSIGRACSKEA